ncbi:imidazoleglycerol-phosphate dehydratase HisB [Desulfurispora thermophila]|uniref:imidazoleglycerol-phosphate dehydratase HisB n=1 Tax=Desulfurispora thermophila TaxID=265470 RepID=UPI000361DBFF|nr:imidazoleglycerol-phosphate dehydratase HisB [Desulfurispora thermophila]
MMENYERKSTQSRHTQETRIDLTLSLDGSGHSRISTGIGFLDHMLQLLTYHAAFDLELAATGDLHVDGHHTVEDVGITLGRALAAALGDKKGIARYGQCFLPMDETLVLVALDISGRGLLVEDLQLPPVMLGSFAAELVPEFLRALAHNAGITLHVRQLSGSNTHHIIEAVFKGLGRALRQAVARAGDNIPSTKGVL